jgi:hypothetical protein
MTGKPNLLELQNVWEFNPYMLLLDLVGLCPSKSVSCDLSALQHPSSSEITYYSIIIICFLSTFYSMFLANLYTEEIVSSWTGSKSNPMTYEVEASSTGPYY